MRGLAFGAVVALAMVIGGGGNRIMAAEMTAAAKNEVVQAFADELINAHDASAIDRLFTEDYREHTPTGADQPAEAFKGLATAMFSAFPDVTVKYTPLVSENDLITVLGSATATHTGDFFGIAPTGRQVSWTEMHVFRIRGEQIAERWVQTDVFGLMQQLTAQN